MPTPLNLKAFVPPNSPILRQKAELLRDEEIGSSQTKQHIKTMLRVALGEQNYISTPLLVGLAAPQIGIPKRIILVDVAANGKGSVGNLHVFINPEIIWSSADLDRWYEGCFSTGCICGIVHRPENIRVKWINADGSREMRAFSGYTARIFQHEIDHLDGKVFVDRILDDDDIHWVERSKFAAYRNDQGWRNWPHKCTRARWEEMLKGP
ncbi:MAG TPA: peptide deformylase [Candidatus Paceibacterota bacterium]